MSLIKDFKQFRDFKKNKQFYTHKLYLAKLGHYYVSSSYQGDGITNYQAEFKDYKYVILEEMNPAERAKYLHDEYTKAGRFLPTGINFDTPFYKIITMGGKIVPLINHSRAMKLGDGVIESVNYAKPLTSVFDGLSEIIDVEYIKSIEERLNTKHYKHIELEK